MLAASSVCNWGGVDGRIGVLRILDGNSKEGLS